jgi:hypothetical protein
MVLLSKLSLPFVYNFSLIKEIFLTLLFDKIKGACILENQILGLVKEGKFIPVKSPSSIAELEKSGIRLIENIAHIAEPQAPIPLDLTKYEGKVIMVGGKLRGGTMYTAKVIDEAGPILTTVVLELFGKDSSL